MKRGAAIMLLLTFLMGCGTKLPEEYTQHSSDPKFIKAKLAKYTTVALDFDRTILNESQLQVLEKLVEAAKCIDEIFWRQSDFYSIAIREELSKSKSTVDRDYLHFLNINYGPFDRQDNNTPFVGTREKPAGAGLYPVDLAKEEFEHFIQANPDLEADLTKLNTIIKRDGENLVAIPYETEYKQYLEPAAQALLEASELTENESLRKYLRLRSEALLSGDFFESDMAWMDLEDNLLDIVIGPIETYEDQLMGLKASYEALVLIKDPEESERFAKFKDHLANLEQNLPVPNAYKKSEVALSSSIGIFTSINRYGDANAGTKTIAISLPNDERVREQKGARSLQLKNVILAKYNKILVPIAEELIENDQLEFVDGDAFFTNVLMHELAHPMGLNYIRNSDVVTPRDALRDYYSTIEEAKADVVGLYNISYFINNNILPRSFEQKAYVTFLASIFRSVRFGAASAHGKANMLEFNYLMKNGSILFDGETGKYAVNFARMKRIIRNLANELLIIEGDGDYDRAQNLISDLSNITKETQNALNRLSDIPVDLEFEFTM